MDVSKRQMALDKNALRGLYNRQPEPRTMQQLLLLCGEEIQPAVREMVRDQELILMQVQSTIYYDTGLKMKPYRLT